MQVYWTVEKDAQMNRTAQKIREIVLSPFFQFAYGFVFRKMTKLVAHMLKKYLHSIYFEIHADYVTLI